MLTIEPDAQTMQTAMRQAARQISRLRPVAGFRPGRAPYGMVERIYGRETVLRQALDTTAADLYRQAVEKAGVEPYEPAQLEIESEDPVVLKAKVALTPVVTLSDYASLQLEPEPEISITEEQVDDQVEAVRRQHAEVETVERPVEFGDQVVAKVVGTSGGETVVDQARAVLDITDALMPPGFAEALLGAEVGDDREFSLTYPEAYDEENLAGKEVNFEVWITTVRQVTLPEVNDDLAKMAGDCDTLVQLREGLAETLKRRLEQAARQRESNAAIDLLVEQATVEYPVLALERELEAEIDNRKTQLQRMGLTIDTYLRMIKKSEEEMREDLRPEVERSFLRRLVLGEYARAVGVSLDEEETASERDALADSLVATYGERADEMLQSIETRGGLASLYGRALARKATQHLVNRLTGREEAEASKAPPHDESGQSSSEPEPEQ